MDALAREYGQPFYTNKDGRDIVDINERYWAGLYAREKPRALRSGRKKLYRYEDESGLWLNITPESIRETISARILEVSREAHQLTLEIQITLTKLKAIIGALMGIVEKRGVFLTKQRFIHVANGMSMQMLGLAMPDFDSERDKRGSRHIARALSAALWRASGCSR